jgi:hypothetical protein
MKAKLAEIIAKATRDPTAYRDLTLVYQRGHDLSGITRFELRADGAFTLSTNNPRRQTAGSFDGQLEPDQRDAIIGAIEQTGLLSVPSSSRPIGDGELPIIVDLSYDDLRHRLMIWASDAANNAGFQHFEQVLWPILRGIAGDKIGPGPTASAA